MSIERQYELVYIVLPDTTEEALAELHTQIVGIVDKFQGKVERTENWGRRRLAYEINRQREGVYVFEVLNGPPAMTAELDRRLRVMDVVMRHLVIRVDEEQQVAERAKTKRQSSMAARRVRRGLPPEPTEQERRRSQDDDDSEGGDMDFGERGDR